MVKNKVLVIGLDGATWDNIKPWAEKGELPTFEKLLDEGVYGDLKSTIPWATIPAWPSFATGVNPGKHGFFDFFRINENYEMEVETKPSHAIKKPTIWKILSNRGKRVGVFNVPATYPPQRVNGYMITGMLTTSNNYTYPKELKEELERKYNYEVAFSSESGKNVERFLDSLVSQLNQKERLLLDFMEEDLDFLMLVDNGTDRVQHECWKYIDPENPLYDRNKAEKAGNPILRYYKHVDSFLSSVLEKLDENTILFLISDHGQGPLRYFVNLNAFLMKEGYMKVRKNALSLLKYGLFRAGFTPRNCYKILEIFGLERKATQKMQFGGKMSLVNKLFFSGRDIDWSNTKAFASGVSGSIRVNLKGREKKGIVEPEEYESLCNEIIEKLEDFRDKDGSKVVEFARKSDEIYHGDYLEEAPDVIATPARDYHFFGMYGFTFKDIITPTFGNSGKHTENGIFLMYQKGTEREEEIKDLEIIDMFPTIMNYLLGVELDHLDGKIIDLKEKLNIYS